MMQVDEESHHWSSIEMFLNWLSFIEDGTLQQKLIKDYIKKGFENCLKFGYDIRKFKEDPQLIISNIIKRRKYENL